MTAPQQALESVAERARRALRDNEPTRPPAVQDGLTAVDESVSPQVEGHLPQRSVAAPTPRPQREVAYHGEQRSEVRTGPAELVEQRMAAIQLVREFEPRRICLRERVRELTQRLADTPADSLHYGQLLQRLAEAHGELVRLEGYIEEARHVIRSTEWLMEMLTDPSRCLPAGQSEVRR